MNESASDMLAVCRFVPAKRSTCTASANHSDKRNNKTDDHKSSLDEVALIEDPTVGCPLPYEQSDNPNDQENEQHTANDHRGSVCFPHRNLHSAVFKRLFLFYNYNICKYGLSIKKNHFSEPHHPFLEWHLHFLQP